MKAIGFKTSLSLNDANSFIEFETEKPIPTGYDLLIKVAANGMNPVDFKIRASAAKDQVLDTPKVIGWDAVGTVLEVGNKTSRFKVGDEVFYAGDLMRSGCNAEFQLVDERIVGHKPKNVTIAEAAAMPLTGLTAYEALFDRIRINPEKDAGKTVLILAGAGGVGSVAIQLAKQLGKLTVIATASREDSQNWCKKMGADFVINHRNDIKEELKNIGHPEVDIILDFVDIDSYFDLAVEIIKPQGHILTISDSGASLNMKKLKAKSVSFYWELMYTRSMFQTSDMARQHEILNHLSELLDHGIIKSTLTTTLEGFTADNLKEAHRLQESGKSIGKTVVVF